MSQVQSVKGDVIPTDCNVTCSDVRTPAKPKYALKCLWEPVLIPTLEVRSFGGTRRESAGAIKDNAGTHKEEKYHEWLQDEFA